MIYYFENETDALVFVLHQGKNFPFEENYHLYGVDWFGYKQSFQDLGVQLFQLLFSGRDYLEVKLTHEQSQIKRLFFYHERINPEPSFLKVVNEAAYSQYDYFRQEVSKFPFSGLAFSARQLSKGSLPRLFYGWTKEIHNVSYCQKVDAADQLIVVFSTRGLCALGSLFLDISAFENKQDEICLENPSMGFGGVQEHSLECRFWLPGSFGFYTESLDDLTF